MSYDANEAKSLFLRAVELGSPADRAALLDSACDGRPELKSRVEDLLRSATEPDSLFDQPLSGLEATRAEFADGEESTLDFLDPSSLPGSLGRLGHYEIMEEIGRGGMGVVLRAIDAKLNRVVAIKVLAPELARNLQARKRFLREAQAAAAVSHDHVVMIHAVDDAARAPYMVMEFISGQSLQQKIDKAAALGLKEVLRIGMQIAAGLAAAHRQGLIHRDIKPANILLENGVERVKITDFGLARAANDSSLTTAGVIAGTPNYMSPEQARGETIDARTDLFSLGSVMYSMCVGQSPFRASTTMGVLKRVCDETPRPIGELNPEIPEWLVRTIDRLMAKDADQRFQTALEVENHLSQQLAHVAQPARQPLPTLARQAPGIADRGRRRRLAAWLISFAMLVACVWQFGPSVLLAARNQSCWGFELADRGALVTLKQDGRVIPPPDDSGRYVLKPGKYDVEIVPPAGRMIDRISARRRFLWAGDDEPVASVAAASISLGRGETEIWAVTFRDQPADSRGAELADFRTWIDILKLPETATFVEATRNMRFRDGTLILSPSGGGAVAQIWLSSINVRDARMHMRLKAAVPNGQGSIGLGWNHGGGSPIRVDAVLSHPDGGKPMASLWQYTAGYAIQALIDRRADVDWSQPFDIDCEVKDGAVKARIAGVEVSSAEALDPTRPVAPFIGAVDQTWEILEWRLQDRAAGDSAQAQP